MVLKKSSNVFVSNFDLVYKLLIYFLVIGVFMLSGAIFIYIPTIKDVVDEVLTSGIFGNVRESLSQLLTFSSGYQDSLVAVKQSLGTIDAIIASNSGRIVAAYFGFAFIVGIGEFLLCIGYFSVSDISATFMKTSMNDLFVTNIFRNIKVSLIFALTHVLFSIPLNTLIIWIGIKVFLALIGSTALAPMLLIIVVITLWALKTVFFIMWLPTIINEKKKVLPSLIISFKLGFKHFFNFIFRYWILGMFCWILLVISAITTFGVALIIAIPASITFLKVYEQVTYFDIFKQKYYLSETEVYAPRE